MKHDIVKKWKAYALGDFYLFRILCSCGKELGAWTVKDVEKEFEKHVKENK